MTLPPQAAAAQSGTALGPRIRPCTHCGLEMELADPPPPATAAVYCCHGCETAAAIIRGAGLEQYYVERDRPAPRPGTKGGRPLAQGIAIETLEDGKQRARFQVDGLQCAACVWVTEKVLQGDPAVLDATVSYATGRAELVLQAGSNDLEPLLQRIQALGYHPRAFELAPARSADRDLLLRLGVASFAAMNVMMLSVGVYLGWFSGMSESYAALFRTVNLALATPVALWSAAPFYSAAWTALRHRVLSMDLPISIGVGVLWLHGVLSTLVLRQDGYLDSMSMLVALLLAGRLVEQRGRRHTAEAATALASTAPAWARRLRVDGEDRVPADSLLPGDRVAVAAGEELPCDGRVLQGSGRVEMALLTGEAEPAAVAPGDPVVAGGVMVDGNLIVEVEAVAGSTLLARMAQGLRDAVDRPPAPDAADRIAPWFTALTLITAALTFAGWWWAAGTGPALKAAVAVLVVACPCALSLARPLAIAAGLGAAARRGLLFRSGDALLRLADIDGVAVDKTGTVTGGVPEVIAGDDATLRIAAGLERHSIHPVARAIVAEATARGIPVPAATDVVETAGQGITGLVNGVPVSIFAGDSPGEVVVSGIGSLLLRDRTRPDAAQAVAALGRLGLAPTLLTGDHPDVAAPIAAGAGILSWQARQRPDDKAAWIQQRQDAGQRWLFVGDGINDGPALGVAEVGIAMGSGSASSLLVADAVVAAPGLQPVVAGLVIAQETLRATRKNLRRSLIYNVLAVAAAVAGLVNPLVAALLMPLSSAAVLVGALAVERRVRRRLANLTTS